ncbi:hypothetical protein PJI17_32020, partial [Mycobacterium kansasii]
MSEDKVSQFADLLEQLKLAASSPLAEDSMIWKGNRFGIFSVVTFYSLLSGLGETPHQPYPFQHWHYAHPRVVAF